MPFDLDAKGSAPVRNIQIEPNLTKHVNVISNVNLYVTDRCRPSGVHWRADPMACFGLIA
jgi:hypothetical protein